MQSAYVDARYEMNFTLSPEDLAEMKTRVESLRTRVHSFNAVQVGGAGELLFSPLP